MAHYYRLPPLLASCHPWWQNFVNDAQTFERGLSELKKAGGRYVYLEDGQFFTDDDPSSDHEDCGVLFDNDEDFTAFRLKWT